MPIVVKCECGKQYKLADDKAGKKMRCRECQAVLAVPAAAAADDFGDFDDFGEDDMGEDLPPKSRSGKSGGGSGKSKKKGAGKKKGGKKGSEMSPAVKYSICGGIVVVTVGIVVGILFARGVLGGKDKATPGESNVAANERDDEADRNPPRERENEPAGRPDDDAPGNTGGGGTETPNEPAGNGKPTGVPNPDETPPPDTDANPPVEEPAEEETPEISAAQLVANNPAGSKTMAQKPVRVRGTVAKPWNDGWLFLTGAGNREVACKFETPPMRQPAVGETVVVEGIFAESAAQYISLGSSKLVPSAESTGEGDGGKPDEPTKITAAELINKYPAGGRVPQGETVQVSGTVSEGWNQGWIKLTGDGRRTVACRFQSAPDKQPVVEGKVTIQGFLGESTAQYVTLGQCRLVQADAPGGRGDRPVAGDSGAPAAVSGRLVRSWNHNAPTNEEKNSISSLAFSPDGKILAAGGRDAVVKLWDPATGENIASWKGHKDFIHHVAFDPQGKYVASGDRTEIKLWEVATGRNTATLKREDSFLDELQFRPDGKALAVVAGGVTFWDVSTGKESRRLTTEGGDRSPNSMSFSNDGKLIATGDSSGGVQLWNAETLKPHSILREPPQGEQNRFDPIEDVAFSPDGKTLVGPQSDDVIHIWDVETKRHWTTQPTAPQQKDYTSPCYGAAFSPDGAILATVGPGPHTKLWDVKTGKQVGRLTGRGSLLCVAYSPDGKFVATGDTDNVVNLFEVKRATPNRANQKNVLKQIGLAMHNHHDVHRRLPGHGANADGSQKGLSWRVHLLPFLGQQPLYAQFKLNEPWDGEHNKKLIAKMPGFYKVDGVEDEGKTSIHLFVGKGTAFGGQDAGPRIFDILDGTSNTILTVVAGPDKADVWTKPGGIPFDPEGDPLKSLGDVPGESFLAGFFDGSVRTLSKSIDPKTLKLLIQHADGQKIPDF